MRGGDNLALQLGHGIAAVETFKRAETLMAVAKLQLGHGIAAVETGARAHAGPMPDPLQLGHGIAAVETGIAGSAIDHLVTLQLDHGIAAVETGGAWEWREKRIPLQLGHGIAAVETSNGRLVMIPASRSFNWATASLPWKHGRTHEPSLREITLQLGHGIAAVETIARPSNGRTPLGFNWATASLPWKRGLQSLGAVLYYKLQLGHGIAAVETVLHAAPLGRHPQASIGPRHRCRGNSPPGGAKNGASIRRSVRAGQDRTAAENVIDGLGSANSSVCFSFACASACAR